MTRDDVIRRQETQYGFNYGAAEVERMCCDEKKGWVVLGINTPKCRLQVYVTKTGKVRVFGTDGKEWKQ